MKAQQRNNRSGRRTFLIIGMLVAFFVMIQGNNWSAFGGDAITQKLSISTKHVKGKVMFLGRLTKNVMNTFD